MKKIVVLGAGMVGRAIILDMARRCDVVAVDVNKMNLAKLASFSNVECIRQDLSDSVALGHIISSADLVISAVPGSMGFCTLKTIIENRKNVVDIAFFPEDAFELDELAGENGVTAVVDCGVAPGMSNLLLGYHHSQMQVNSFTCYVGGLPVERRLPFEYKAPFSPSDVIEEYIRPARLVKDSRLVIREALSDPELMDFEGIGTLEAFNTDGLRSLIKTMSVPDMVEKTLRYPGHIEKIRLLKECGFFDQETISDLGIAPIDVSSRLMFEQWRLNEEDAEFTVMRIEVAGLMNGKNKKFVYDLLDRYDPKTKTSSMARTTGYTCCAAANLVLDQKFLRKGICPPEYISENHENMEYIFKYLKDRNIIYKLSES